MVLLLLTLAGCRPQEISAGCSWVTWLPAKYQCFPGPLNSLQCSRSFGFQNLLRIFRRYTSEAIDVKYLKQRVWIEQQKQDFFRTFSSSSLKSYQSEKPKKRGVLLVENWAWSARYHFLKLVTSDGLVLHPTDTLQVADGDHFTALVPRVEVTASKRAFALWCHGGDGIATWFNSAQVSAQVHRSKCKILREVRQVEAVEDLFAALLSDGSVVKWGREDFDIIQIRNATKILACRCGLFAVQSNGECVPLEPPVGLRLTGQRLWNVQQIKATDEELVVLLEDGHVETYDLRPRRFPLPPCPQCVREPGSVQQIRSTSKSVCALLADGTAIAWGDPRMGGGRSYCYSRQPFYVRRIEATEGAFAAILANECVVAWGDPNFGGDCSKVQHQLIGVQQNLFEWTLSICIFFGISLLDIFDSFSFSCWLCSPM